MAKIYTRTGDAGETSLGDGSRTAKNTLRVDLYGDVDELNSLLGVCVADLVGANLEVGSLADQLVVLQNRLFDLGSVLANPGQSAELAQRPTADQPFSTIDMEDQIDDWDADLAPLSQFILPGGHPAAAALHLARTVCRRVERKAVTLAEREKIPAGALIWLNRLSDYLFVAARACNAAAGTPDVSWTKES